MSDEEKLRGYVKPSPWATDIVEGVLSDRDSLRARLGAHHVGDLTDGGHCAMCDAAARKAREGE